MSNAATKQQQQMELFSARPPRLMALDSAPVLFPALTPADYAPAGFLARLSRTERRE
jgi:hypothetical protein